MEWNLDIAVSPRHRDQCHIPSHTPLSGIPYLEAQQRYQRYSSEDFFLLGGPQIFCCKTPKERGQRPRQVERGVRKE